jgi:hypothetical protein
MPLIARTIGYPVENSVLPHLSIPWHLTRTQLGAASAAVLSLLALAWYALHRKRLSPEERERLRRSALAASGRLIDGTITGIDADTEDTSADGSLPPTTIRPARLLRYRYRIAGVTYECAQDVSTLPDHVRHLRIDLPVQVRYNPQNPADSILVAEAWSGLQHRLRHVPSTAAPKD